MFSCWLTLLKERPLIVTPGVFITISPSERHSVLTLRLLRKCARDPWVTCGEPNFKALMQKLASADHPSLQTVTQEWADMNNCECAELALPEYKLRTGSYDEGCSMLR